MAWTERYVSVAGAGAHDGTSEANAWTLAEAITNAVAGHRVNVINGTYANTTTDLTFAGAGTSSTAIWWRGYNTTIGDIDSNNSLTKPIITFTTGFATISGTYQWFSNIRWEGADTSASEGVVRVSGPNCRFWRCRFEGTAADADCIPLVITTTGDRATVVACYFKANALAPCLVILDVTHVHGCAFDGGLNGISVTAGTAFITACIFDDQASHAINNGTGSGVFIANCSIYSPAGDGVRIAAAANTCAIINNIFESCGVYAINSTAAASAGLTIWNNAYRASGTADLNGVLESQQVGDVTETSTPFTNAAGDDFSLVSGALSRQAGYPGTFEGYSNTGYPDIGAVSRQESGGSSVFLPIGGTMRGGF
jgi:hypothetical protein